MPLEFCAVMPHGGALIPGLEEAGVSDSLTAAMREAAKSAAAAGLDALVIATPHGVAMDEAHTIALSDRIAGTVGHIGLSAQIHRPLAMSILQEAQLAEIPAVGIVSEDQATPLPMDWGVLIPTWFIAQEGTLPPLVVICPSRPCGLESMVGLGEAVADVAQGSALRIGLVASADNAHAHQPEGPYGFHPSAKAFDDIIVKLTESGDLEGYIGIDETLIDEALPDSPWQLAMLTGAARRVPLQPARVVYDCPSYFGMMVAVFEPT